MANNIGWGEGNQNNTIGWGKAACNNTIGWGIRYLANVVKSGCGGLIPSFALNFNTIASDFTFTRNSFATRVNENGLIETVTNLGDDLVTNGDFENGENDWTLGNGWSIEDGKAESNGAASHSFLSQSIPFLSGVTYKITFDIVVDSGSFVIRLSGSGNNSGTTISSSQTQYTEYITTTANRMSFNIRSNDGNSIGSIDNIVVKEVIEDDIPRIDYSTGEAAFLLEPQSTNLYLNSENLSTQNVTTLASTYTVSFRGTGTITFSGTHTGSLVGTGSMDLVSTTFLATAGTLISTVSGDVKYAQIEELSYATSYIPTEGSTVTRSAETCVNATPTINSEEGVLYAEFNVLDSANSYKMIEINDGISGSDRVVIYAFGGNIYGLVKSNGVTNLNIFSIKTVTDFNKVAIKWGTDETALWINGVEINTGSGSAFNADVLDNLSFLGAGTQYFYGDTKDLKIYDKALTDEELTELTTI